MKPDIVLNKDDLLVSPDHAGLVYSGRIDFSNSDAPCFIYAGSQVHFRFKGTDLKIIVRNYRSYYDSYIGYIIDNKLQGKLKLDPTDTVTILPITQKLEDLEHDVIIYKRQDAAHYFDFLGIVINKTSVILDAPAKPLRRMECFGDSVSAGEVCEAIEYVGKPDPEHSGEFSNSWYSYTSITARKLGAQLHNNGQGGLALLDQTGYFLGPDYVGLESTYDKLRYNTQLGPYSLWDFNLYTPHVVLVAIGQNDSHPENYMGKDKQKSDNWKYRYKAMILQLRKLYPKALIILKTTILNHSKEWDDAIDEVTKALADPKIVHFLYTNNGCGTPGHIRIPEAQQMAEELTEFINSFGDSIWE